MNRLVTIWHVGRIKYGEALQLQKQLAEMHHKESVQTADTLVLLEHDPVYTTGIREKQYKDKEHLISLGAEFHHTNRGGLITFHGPGQLVVYPVINLKHFKPSVRWYVEAVENTVIDLCQRLGISTETSPHTGVWVGDNKICAIGVHASRYVTTHGFALNCNTDLKWFEHIIPCGIEGKGVTSLSQELGKEFTVEQTIPLLVDSFCRVFDCGYSDFKNERLRKVYEKAV